MSETSPKKSSTSDVSGAVVAPEPGPVSQWLNNQGFDHISLEPDHLGVEQIGVEAAVLPMIVAALKSNGFDYLQCQGYDEGPGEQLVCFYHLLAMAEQVEAMAAEPSAKLREVRIKVFLSREGAPRSPRSMACSVVPIGRSVKPSTCTASNLRGIRIPNGC